jgi:glycosyltransferase involved in cell wall biosynthesis
VFERVEVWQGVHGHHHRRTVEDDVTQTEVLAVEQNEVWQMKPYRLDNEAAVPTALVQIDRPPQYLVGGGRTGPTVSVVIPAMNEALNLPDVFAALDPDLYEVILVDGNSTDDTVEEARRLRPDITIIGQNRKGKGNALACGFKAASGDYIVMLDADGSTDPAEIPRFVAALKEGADFAKGSRFLPGGGSNDISRLRQMGNFWLNKVVNLLYGTRYTDLCYGYNAFRRQSLSSMDLDGGHIEGIDEGTMLWGDGFEVETLINVRVAKAGLRVAEVPSFEHERRHGTSNLHAFSDGIRVLRTIYAERKRGTRRTAAAVRASQRQEKALAPIIPAAA